MLFFKKKCKDKYQTKDFFKTKLKKINKSIAEFNKWVDIKSGLENYYLYIQKLYKDKIIILYTLNYDKEKIKKCANEYIKYIKAEYELKNQLSYNEIVIGLSLSLIFNIDLAEIKF